MSEAEMTPEGSGRKEMTMGMVGNLIVPNQWEISSGMIFMRLDEGGEQILVDYRIDIGTRKPRQKLGDIVGRVIIGRDNCGPTRGDQVILKGGEPVRFMGKLAASLADIAFPPGLPEVRATQEIPEKNQFGFDLKRTGKKE